MKNLTVSCALAASFLFAVGCGSPPDPATAAGTSATSATTPGDADGDGIPDAMDKCLDKKEDGLGANPKDGCPDTSPLAAPGAPKP